MSQLNYNHLRYFHAVAREGNLTRAAKHLRLSQSALSVQLRSLEQSLGHALFERRNRSLSLTEAGHIALEYAEGIFRSGEELATVLQQQGHGDRRLLRIGAASNLSRNFQLGFVSPLLKKTDSGLVIHSGSLSDLLTQLQAHTLDVVLSNTAVKRDGEARWHCHLLDEQPVSLIGHRVRGRKALKFPEDLHQIPVVLPSLDSSIRTAFDNLMHRLGVRPIIAAEVDDMAMLRLMARECDALTLVPPVVVKDELESGLLVERHRLAEITETFYAITPSRRFPNPLLAKLINRKKTAR
jgi:LysR family transcriptional activator of nhaA